MAVTTAERARSRCRDRIAMLARSRAHPDEARREAVAEIRRAVGFDQWCWMVTDPMYCTHAIAEMAPSFWAYVPRLVLAEEADPCSVARQVSGASGVAAAALSSVTGGDLARSRRWDECLRPAGIGDELTVACRDVYGCWGLLVPCRDSGDPHFADGDVQLLADVSPALATITRRVQAGPALAARVPPPGLAILDAGLAIISWSATAGPWIAELAGSIPGSAQLTIAVVAAHLRARRRESLPGARLRTAGGAWAVLDASVLHGDDRGRIAVTLRGASPAEVLDLTCRAFALTGRERQLVRHVVDGRSTGQIAERMTITGYTVKDHLKSVFRKLGVSTRGELIRVVVTG